MLQNLSLSLSLSLYLSLSLSDEHNSVIVKSIHCWWEIWPKFSSALLWQENPWCLTLNISAMKYEWPFKSKKKPIILFQIFLRNYRYCTWYVPPSKQAQNPTAQCQKVDILYIPLQFCNGRNKTHHHLHNEVSRRPSSAKWIFYFFP